MRRAPSALPGVNIHAAPGKIPIWNQSIRVDGWRRSRYRRLWPIFETSMTRYLSSRLKLFAILGLLCANATAVAASIESFAPNGEVKGVRQVTARFSAAIVPFGDPRELAPFAIACNPADMSEGNGRWADTRNWVYDFEQDLPAGDRLRRSGRWQFRSAEFDTDVRSRVAGDRKIISTGQQPARVYSAALSTVFSASSNASARSN